MRISEILWGDWNRDHITKHGGSVDLAETVLRSPQVTVTITAARLAKAQAVIITRAWTVVLAFEPLNESEIRVYPTPCTRRNAARAVENRGTHDRSPTVHRSPR